MRVLAGFLRPIILGNVQHGAMVVYRRRYCCWAVRFCENMMAIHRRLSFFFPFAFMADDRIAASDQSFRSYFTTGASAVRADLPRGNGLTHICSLRIALWQFVSH